MTSFQRHCEEQVSAVTHPLSGVIIYGAGGHGVVVADIVERQAKHRVIGFIDDNPQLWGRELFGYKILGGVDILVGNNLAHYPVIIAIGDNRIRKQVAIRLSALGCTFTPSIHPSAQIARTVQIGIGTMVMANVAINPGTKIGEHVIVNTSATVDHDCAIGDFVHISPAAVLAGNVIVDDGVHLGMGCSVLPGIHIGEDATIGAGAVVTKNISAGVTAVGVPARPIGSKEDL